MGIHSSAETNSEHVAISLEFGLVNIQGRMRKWFLDEWWLGVDTMRQEDEDGC